MEREIKEIVDNYMREYDAKIDHINQSVRRIEKTICDLYSKWNKAMMSMIGLLVMIVLGLISYIWVSAGF